MDIQEGSFSSPIVPDPVEYRVLLPEGWSRAERLPLLLVLHGANSSGAVLESFRPFFDSFPRAVVACASTPTVGGFYIGPWESLVADAFPAHLSAEFGVDLGKVALLGSSMGGYGGLKMAFRHPERYVGVAALAPALFPVETAEQIRPRNTIWVLQQLLETMAPAFAENHVVSILRTNRDAIRERGLAISLDCGDHDVFNFQDGTEYLHRVLWDLDVSHEYRLVRNADHVGPEFEGRLRSALAFLAEALIGDERPPNAMRAQIEPLLPETDGRRYGVLPTR